MPRISYTREDLHIIAQSPLVRRPDSLPNIEQWFELPSQTRLPKSQGGRLEEPDTSTKRPSLFEHRQRTGHSHSGAGDDFLGPRSSFATLSAQRQTSRNLPHGDHGAGDALRNRTNRYLTSREKETNGHADGDNKPRLRERRGSDAEDDRGLRTRPRPRDEELDPPKRPFGRGIRDQPWTREGGEKSWRDKERKEEQDWPRGTRMQENTWTNPIEDDGPTGRTAEDLQAFMTKMRAGAGDSPNEVGQEDAYSDRKTQNIESTKKTVPSSDVPGGVSLNDNVFGVWGDAAAKPDAKPELDATQAAKANAKNLKKSRFFPGSMGPDPTPPPSSHTPPEAGPSSPPFEAPLPNSKPLQKSAEDVAGFERMMAMLRMGGNTPKDTASNSALPPPPHPPQNHPNPLDMFAQGQMRGPPLHEVESRRLSPPTGLRTPPPSAPPGYPSQHPPPMHAGHRQNIPSKDSEFLMNLMRQSAGPASRTPFNEAQIYGQPYGRPSPDMSQLLSNLSPAPQGAGPRGPPPGPYNRNEHAFATNTNMEMPPEPPRHSMRSPDEYRGMPEPPFPRHDSFSSPPGMQFFEDHARRPPGLAPPNSINAPPGFGGGGGRGQSGFINFPPPMNQPGVGPPGMRPPMPQQPPGLPPGFFNGPPGLGRPGPGPDQDPRGRPLSGHFPGMMPRGPMMDVPPGYMMPPANQLPGGPQRR